MSVGTVSDRCCLHKAHCSAVRSRPASALAPSSALLHPLRWHTGENPRRLCQLLCWHTKTTRDGRQRALPVVAALTESGELALGTPAPGFQLPNPATGKLVRLEDFAGAPATLVMFICNHCPFVKMLKEAFVELANDYQLARGVAIVAISSNSTQTHPQDGPEQMAEDAKTHGYPFPYLYDETQEVAKAYSAVCTPEFYVFDQDMKLAYHGQFDGARPKNDVPVTGEDLRAALDDVLAGRPVARPVRPSIGCNIKWHPGNELN